MLRRLSPVAVAIALIALTLLAVATGRDEASATLDGFGDPMAAVIALVSEDGSAAPAPKCGKPGGHSGSHTQAPGVLVTALDPCPPRLAIGYARPSDLDRLQGRALTPELSPPETIAAV